MLPTMQSAEAITREEKQQFEEENPGVYWTENTIEFPSTFKTGDKPYVTGRVADIDIDQVLIVIYGPCNWEIYYDYVDVPTDSQNAEDGFDLDTFELQIMDFVPNPPGQTEIELGTSTLIL